MGDQIVSVSEFVALVNQTLDFAYPSIRVEGEVSEFRISKNRWVYFNITDEHSSVRIFATVYQLQQPIEDGMKVVVKGTPKLHNKYGFSLNATSILPSGEGSIKRAFEMLKKKLTEEGLFDESRKRSLPEFPGRIGLITSAQAAAYGDFMKILDQRWSGVTVRHADVQVQGVDAPRQIVAALQRFSESPEPVDVIVITRGGGSSEDLQAFSTEEVARAIAGSRIPTIVGVGHEIDVSLADMAADMRATTPTNAAQLAVPSKEEVIYRLQNIVERTHADTLDAISRRKQLIASLGGRLDALLSANFARLGELNQKLVYAVRRVVSEKSHNIEILSTKLQFMNPMNLLSKGYSLVSFEDGTVLKNAKQVARKDRLVIRLEKGQIDVEVEDVKG